MKAKELILMIDEGVPIQVAAIACGCNMYSLSENMKKELLKRQAIAKSKVLRSLFGVTSRSSASASEIANCARTWVKLSENDVYAEDASTDDYSLIKSDNDLTSEIEKLKLLLESGE